MRKILFVNAHSLDAKPVKSTEEYHKILKIVDFSEYQILQLPNPNRQQFVYFLRKEKPCIFHFSGHGFAEGEPILFDKTVIEPDELVDMLKDSKNLYCIFLNSCNSADILEFTREIIEFSIGIQGKIYSNDAVKLAKTFYKYLFEGHNIPLSFHKTCEKLGYYTKTKKITPILKTKSSFFMEKFFKEQDINYLNEIAPDIRQCLIDVNEKLFQVDKDLRERLINSHSFQATAIWFCSIRNELPFELTKIILVNKTEEEQEIFQMEIDIYLDTFESLLINMDGKERITKKRVSKFEQSNSNSYYIEAFDRLIIMAHNVFFESKEQIVFFEDRIRFFQNLIKQ